MRLYFKIYVLEISDTWLGHESIKIFTFST